MLIHLASEILSPCLLKDENTVKYLSSVEEPLRASGQRSATVYSYYIPVYIHPCLLATQTFIIVP